MQLNQCNHKVASSPAAVALTNADSFYSYDQVKVGVD